MKSENRIGRLEIQQLTAPFPVFSPVRGHVPALIHDYQDGGYPSVVPVVQLIRYLILEVHRHVRVLAQQGIVQALRVAFLK